MGTLAYVLIIVVIGYGAVIDYSDGLKPWQRRRSDG